MNEQNATAKSVLYLNTRGLKLERDAEIFTALEMGLQVIIAAPDRKPFEAYPIEHIIEVPSGNCNAAQKIILQYLEDHQLPVHGIVCWTDKEVELTARIGSVLGLPSSPPAAVENVRNKARLRRLLDELPALNPAYRSFTDEQSFKAALTTVGVPAIIKPAGASGGRGILRIRDAESALQHYHAFRQYCQPERDEIFAYFAGESLLEEELPGSEHSIAGTVIDKEGH